MLIQKVNRTDAERIILICENVSGATATTGFGLQFLGGVAAENVSADGSQVRLSTSTAGDGWNFAGVADQDIPNTSAGRVIAWGYANSVYLSATADATVALIARAQSILGPGSAAGSFTSLILAEALSTRGYKYVQLMNTVNVSGGLNWGTGFVRAI